MSPPFKATHAATRFGVRHAFLGACALALAGAVTPCRAQGPTPSHAAAVEQAVAVDARLVETATETLL